MVFLTNTNADEKYTANECFEKFSRGTLKFNQALDKAIFKPIAKGYRVLPQPIRTGTNNFVSNLRSFYLFQTMFFKVILKVQVTQLEDLQ